jgi:hypothetical protein
MLREKVQLPGRALGFTIFSNCVSLPGGMGNLRKISPSRADDSEMQAG